MGTITSANAVFLITIPSLYSVPQQLQGFSTDEIFATDPLESAEILMGVDGHQSAGFVFVSISQTIMLQADSVSNIIFDNWWASQRQVRDIYLANGTIALPSIGLKYALTNGALKTYQAVADAGKTLKPRKYTISWENINPAII